MESEYQLSILAFLTGFPSATSNLNLIIELPVLLLLLAGSAILSASESAFLSLNHEEIRALKSEKTKHARTAIKLHSDPGKLLTTITVGNNILNISFILLAIVVGFRLFVTDSRHLIIVISAISVTIFILLLASEILPKLYTAKNRVKVALSMAAPMNALEVLFNPVTSLISPSQSYLIKRIDSNFQSEMNGNTQWNAAGASEDEKIFRGIRNFGNTNVSAIMVPRIDVTAIDIRSPFNAIIPVIINSGFSRIPIYSGSFDSVKGILYAKDVLPFTGNPANFKWQSLLRPSYFVPETKKINDLLKEFQVRKIHMAVVIDEYGGASGIVTLEDILEEIVGDISDESDEEETLFRRIDETKFIFEGRILLNDFCRVFNIDEEIFIKVRGESETLAGLMLELTGEIPQKDQVIQFKNFTFRIESVDRRRIREILVERLKENDETE